MRIPSLRVLFLAVALPILAAAQHAAEGGHQAAANNDTLWKIGNFLILAGLIGYVIYKKGGAFFRSRTEQIQRDLKESAQIRADSERRFAEVERRLALLDAEVAGLRQGAQEESRAEGERIRGEGRVEVEKILKQAEQEIASVAKDARQRLRADAAELAIGLAAGRIRQQLTPETDRVLVDSMVHELASRQAGLRPEAS
jgi:F-type H+-transporting ATPase subunit b